MKNKTLLTLCAAPLLLSVNAMAAGGGAITPDGTFVGEGLPPIDIDENYIGDYAFDGWDAEQTLNGNGVTYNRSFTANKPATIVLPFNMPSGISTNANFYTLQYVIPDLRYGNRTWLAKMQKIETSAVQAHKPYAVIVPDGGKIIFTGSSQVTVKTPGNNDLFNNKTENVNYNGERDDIDVNYEVKNNAGDWYFIGNYNNGTFSSGDPEVGLCYGFEGSNYDGGEHKGQFGKIANGTEKKAFRGLLCKKDNTVQLAKQSANGANMFSLPESINVEFVDTDANGKEHTTYVGKLNRIDNVRLNRERSTFDLKGRNVDGKRTAKGVYLKK